MKKEKIYIITGACGHLGTSIIRYLQETEPNSFIRGLYISGESIAQIPDCVKLVEGNVCTPHTLDALFEELDENFDVQFIHAAGIISISGKNNDKMFDVNVGGTANIIELCKRHRVNRFVYVSSSHAIPELPVGEIICEITDFEAVKLKDPYSHSKAMASQLVLNAVKDGLPAIVIHPTGMIGPFDYGGGYLTQFIANYLSGFLRACVKGGYDFVDVRDVAMGVVSATEHGKIGQCYILSNDYASILNIMDDVKSIAGTPKVKTILPAWFVRMMSPFICLYFKIKKQKPLLTAQSLSVLRANVRFSYSRAEKDLLYKPRSLIETLSDTVQFIRSQYKIPMHMR